MRPLKMQGSEKVATGSLTSGEEALLVGHYTGCGGNRQDGRDAHELEEAADRRQIPLPEGGDERE